MRNSAARRFNRGKLQESCRQAVDTVLNATTIYPKMELLRLAIIGLSSRPHPVEAG